MEKKPQELAACSLGTGGDHCWAHGVDVGGGEQERPGHVQAVSLMLHSSLPPPLLLLLPSQEYCRGIFIHALLLCPSLSSFFPLSSFLLSFRFSAVRGLSGCLRHPD